MSIPTASPVETASPACNKNSTRARAVHEMIPPAESEFPMPLAMDIAAGWKGCGLLYKEAAGGLMMVGMWRVGFVYPDPCLWKQTLAEHPSSGSAADVAQAFADQSGSDATTIEQVSIDGLSARHVGFSVRGDVEGDGCEVDSEAPEFRFMQGMGDSVWWTDAREAHSLIADVWTLDLDGAPFVIQTVHWLENSPADVSEQAAMVESIDFDP